MTTYHGYANTNSAGARLVTVKSTRDERLLRHHVRHSPDGFNWGYGGSGPAELARCLLYDHMGTDPETSLYQAFKFDVIAALPRDNDWILSDCLIQEWLDRYRRSK